MVSKMLGPVLQLVSLVMVAAIVENNEAVPQIVQFKERTTLLRMSTLSMRMLLRLLPLILAALAQQTTVYDGTPGTTLLTMSSGAPVEYDSTSSLNTDLLQNYFAIELLTKFAQERIPERLVHANGAGAFGYFEVTNDITNICKAKLFSGVGKRTPIAVRFSTATGERGSADTVRDIRGFSVKFYTEEGNYDILGQQFPIFLAKDPVASPLAVHAMKANPATNYQDPNNIWDMLTSRPGAFFATMHTVSDQGIPDGYRHMDGHAIHTFHVVNESGKSSFVRFHFSPDAGIKNLSSEQGSDIAGKDPNYAKRDLYSAIENGNFPSWTMSIQILSMEDVKNATFDVFDVTKVLPLDIYPLTEVGRLVLNRNPLNNFAEVEQLAFYPGNLVPGILGAPDKIFQSRIFTYKVSQIHRLGVNYQNIPVNCPFQSRSNTYNRDGVPPVNENGRNGSNYYPNSFNGPVPYVDKHKVQLIKIHETEADNFDHMSDWYESVAEDERDRMVQNMLVGLNLKGVPKFLQERALTMMKTINADLGSRIEKGLLAV